MSNEQNSMVTEISELKQRVQALEKSTWRASKELTVLREMFAALKERAGISGEVRPPLVFKDQHGAVVPQVDLIALTPGEIAKVDRIGTGSPVILKAPEKRRLQTQAYVEARSHEPLYILFHGALQVGEQTPRFERVRSMRQLNASFCAISDPTIDLAEDLTLGWYIGHNAVDLRDVIAPIVEGLVDALEPTQVIFVGGSGGGFAALQSSARIEGSMAFVTDPQVIVPKYYAGHVTRFLRSAFDEFSLEAAVEEFGERLSVVEAYRRRRPKNFVYYCQHRGDKFHAEGHLGPFAELMGVPPEGGQSPDGRMHLEWFSDGAHGPLRAPGQFEATLAKAVAWHRAQITPAAAEESIRPQTQPETT